MGCDIHLHIEVMIDGEWEHWSNPKTPRCYPLFAKMAGVRNYDNAIEAISEPKGFPPVTVTKPTLVDFEHMKGDAHDISWLDREEMEILENYVKDDLAKTGWNDGSDWLDLDLDYHFLCGFCCGNSFTGIGQYTDSYHESITDVRLVFWFDN